MDDRASVRVARGIASVRERLDRYFDELRIRATRFGDAEAIVEALRDASDGGKYVRPKLVLLVHSTLGGDEHSAAIDVAAAFELLHTALVVHDDIIDRDWYRRGKPNIGGRYRARAEVSGASDDDAAHHGASAAVIAGDLALAGSLQLVAMLTTDETRRLRLLRIMDDAVIASAIGELADIEHPHRLLLTADDVARTHRAKTAVYTFEAPLQAGAVLAGASERVVTLLGEFGRHLGTAYQILDDIAGVFGDERETGKQAGGDIRSAKQTTVTVIAQTAPTWPEVEHLFGKSDISLAELTHFRDVLDKGGTFRAAEDQATSQLHAARQALDKLPAELRHRLTPMLATVAGHGRQIV